MVGPLPPPLHGVSVLTHTLLQSPLASRYELVHLDTRDDRGVSNIGRPDLMNAWLAVRHGVRFAAMLARTRPSAVYVPVSQNGLGFLRDTLFLAPAAARGVPLVLHFHGGRFDDFVRGTGPLRPLVRLLMQRTTRAVVLGSALAGMLRGLVPDERVRVIPNGVSDPGHEHRRGHSPTLRVLFIGNLRPDKGYIDLLEAGLRLLSEGVSMELTLAGDVSDTTSHGEVLRRLRPPAEHVRFVGAVGTERRNELLRAADVLVLPSRDEGHPLVVLEAMAAGLPVIASRVSTIPETVIDGETGLVTEPGDIGALAAALRRMTDEGTRLRMGISGRARYVEEYTLERWSARMTALFDDVVHA